MVIDFFLNSNYPSVRESKEGTPEEALELKQALEVARHNFYRGKISMVCLTKAGGYVVKEVEEQAGGEADGGVVVLAGGGGAKHVIPEISIQDADATEKRLEEMKMGERGMI